MHVSHMGKTSAKCEARVRALDRFLIVKQHPGRACDAGDHARERTNPFEGLTSRTGHLGWFLPTLRRISGGLAPFGCPVRLTPSGLGSLKAVTEWVGTRVRDNRSQTAVTRYPYLIQ
jgi:hypothetical protein